MTGQPRQPVITRLTLLVVTLLAGCGGPAPTAVPAPSSVRGETPSAPPALAGLLIAAGGPLQRTDDQGTLVPFEPRTNAVDGVGVAADTILVLETTGQAWTRPVDGATAGWTPLPLPAVVAGIRLLGLARDGGRLAIASGEPAGTSFRLLVRDLDGASATTHRIERGLNGGPVWLDDATIVMNVLGVDGRSELAGVDVRTGAITDGIGPGTTIALSGDGSTIAFDDAATGAAFVGDVADWRAKQPDRATRIDGPPATGVDALALSGDASRLAIVHRADAGTSIEILVVEAGRWTSARTIRLPDVTGASVAWAR